MAFTRKKKILVFSIIVLAIAGVVTASVLSSGKTISEVQIDSVKRKERLESKVTASGEVRPVKFYNLTAEVSGRVTNIYVREGDVVRSDQDLLKVDPTQQANNAASQESVLRAEEQDTRSAEVQWRAAENNVNATRNLILSAQADLKRAQADLALAETEYQRAADMVEAGVFSKSQFDTAKNRLEASKASVEAQKARVEQLEYQLKDAQVAVNRAEISYRSLSERVNSTKAQLRNAQDLLFKTVKKSPIEGVVSSLPVKEGEFVLANLSSSPLMMIADMSNVNVEVKVDETDIANVKLGQSAKVKVDALGETEIDGEVIEIGHSAVTRSGQTIATSTNSQEAKDFKVVVKLKSEKETLQKLRPGMSATATITTDRRSNALTVPIQALVIKDLGAEKEADQKQQAQPGDPQKDTKATEAKPKKEEVQGVFIVKDGKANFVEVKTGITGETEIEVLSGLNENDQIVIGPFRQLRTLKTGTAVKAESSKDKK
ncbi:MAG: HlyD family secretion protein [Blastocatellia bacterium]|nr:HlyD family secretion protein [Blastocatellia bacterium]